MLLRGRIQLLPLFYVFQHKQGGVQGFNPTPSFFWLFLLWMEWIQFNPTPSWFNVNREELNPLHSLLTVFDMNRVGSTPPHLFLTTFYVNREVLNHSCSFWHLLTQTEWVQLHPTLFQCNLTWIKPTSLIFFTIRRIFHPHHLSKRTLASS